jgi:hypothetical protein
MTVMDEMLADLQKATDRLQRLIRDEAGHGTMSWAKFMAEARNELTDALWGEGAAEYLEKAQEKKPHLTFKEMQEVK